jgi:hypothetical protein
MRSTAASSAFCGRIYPEVYALLSAKRRHMGEGEEKDELLDPLYSVKKYKFLAA